MVSGALAPDPEIWQRWMAYVVVGKLMRGMGYLSIGPSYVALETPSPLGFLSGTTRVEKRSGEIQVLRVRVREPWMRTVIQLAPQVHASIGPIARRRVLNQLKESGLRINERRVWFFARAEGLDGQVHRIP